jgi:cystathionine beta-synthase
MQFKKNILELIGNTPLVKLNKLAAGLRPQIFAKLESANPGGSVKDRIGIAMIESAERDGRIKPGGILVEATSGNTGIGLAIAAAIKGYKTIFVVTDKVSIEKVNYLKAFGSDVIVVSNSVSHDSPDYYVTVAKKIAEETPNALFMYQYSNPSNPEIHYKTTGPEIWRQTDGKITHFVSGIGTGGTISGTGRFLKEMNPHIQIIGADPYGSIFNAYKESGIIGHGHPYLVEGIGQDCLPENVHFRYIDKIINVSDQDSFAAARKLIREEGIFCGGSTGTNLHAALAIAKDLSSEDILVFIVADTGERYLSKFYNDEWLREKRLLGKNIKTLGDISGQKKTGIYKEFVFVSSSEKVKDAIHILNDKGFSQLPVIENNHSVGSIKESKLLNRILENPSILEDEVEKYMDESFPVLDSRTNINELKKHLTNSTAVLVSEYNRIIDIVTRYDMIEYVENV